MPRLDSSHADNQSRLQSNQICMAEEKKYYEIFRAGSYPQGTFTEEDIKQIAENYDPELLEAPISIFHWGDRFAYGWINELKAEGEKLMASFKDVSEELKQLVAEKKLKRHSVELYKNFNEKGTYLKALAMLGAETPAVKGMQPIEFSYDGEAEEIQFQDEPSFSSEFTLQFYKKQAQKLQSDLAEEKSKNHKHESEKEALEFSQRKTAFESFLDEKSEKGELPPVIREKCVALFSHLDSIEVKEGSESALDVFKQVISEIKSQVEFGADYDDGGAEHIEFSAEVLAVKAAEFREEQRLKGVSISATQAVNHIKNQNKSTQ